MKKTSIIALLVLIAQFSIGQQFTDLFGDYLGQTTSGNTPVVFARGIISTDGKEHCVPSFSPGGNEVFWLGVRRPGPNRRIRQQGAQSENDNHTSMCCALHHQSKSAGSKSEQNKLK